MSNQPEPPMTSIQARIAALNLGQVVPTSPPPSYDQAVNGKKKGPPPPLPRRPADHRSHSTNNPPLVSNGISSEKTNGNTPASPNSNSSLRGSRPPPPVPGRYGDDSENGPMLPPRRPSSIAAEIPPSLPARRPSQQTLGRKASVESVASVASARSSVSARTSLINTSRGPRIRSPEYDPTSLPPLPQRRKNALEEEEEASPRLPLRPTVSSPTVTSRVHGEEAPSLPARPNRSSQARPPPPPTPSRQPKISPPPDMSNGFSSSRPPPTPNRPTGNTSSPPPIPTSSRPDMATLNASKPRSGAPASGSCLICRDFSAPDAHAARFPRESIPSTDISWIAHNLTSPFPSSTDKARAIFTWLHHNIEYNTRDFFSGNLKSSTPNSTIASGLAVCEGYAALFTALATAAGLESIVVCGHGKGYGFASPDPNGALPPPNPTGHAWNAVRLDDEPNCGPRGWKLIDACWGAGHVQGAGMPYVKQFAPERFTQSNEDFGIDHFPDRDDRFYRADGRALGWREYILRDAGAPQTFSGWESLHGLASRSLEPRQARLARGGDDVVRFSYTKVCRHWNNAVHGAGADYLVFLEIKGNKSGDDKEQRPVVQTDGFTWWIDVRRAELGARAGDQVKLLYLTKLDDDDARGVTAEAYRRWQSAPRGKSWAWGVLAVWDVV